MGAVGSGLWGLYRYVSVDYFGGVEPDVWVSNADSVVYCLPNADSVVYSISLVVCRV